jgi:protein gp37
MGEHTEISWTHHTFNPWWGCLKVSAACEHCYAETWAKRTGHDVWGPGRRRFFGDKHWSDPLKWNRKAAAAGERRRVFCASMCDVFEELPDDHPDQNEMYKARLRLWDLIGETPQLDWLLLTKRPQNIVKHAPWRTHFLKNVWLGTTCENQETADERIPHLIAADAAVRFVSCEPLVGPVDLDPLRCVYGCNLGALPCDIGLADDDATPWCNEHDAEAGSPGWLDCDAITWVITGAESGPKARITQVEWFRRLRDQCAAAGVAFHHKQNGEWVSRGGFHDDEARGKRRLELLGDDGATVQYVRLGKKNSGRLLDGKLYDEFPRP